FQAEDGIRDFHVTGVQTCALPISVSGIVGLVGGLGGFLLPILFGALLDITGVRSSAFMLLYGVTCVSLAWMYWTEVRSTDIFREIGRASCREGEDMEGVSRSAVHE